MDLTSEVDLVTSEDPPSTAAFMTPATVDRRAFTVIQFSSNPFPQIEEEGLEERKRRCFLCLKEEKNEENTSFPMSNRLKPFSPVLRYLMGPPEECGENLDDESTWYSVLAKAFEEEVPPLCIACFDVLGSLYDLHLNLIEIQRNIEMQTCIARSVVKRSSEAAVQQQKEDKTSSATSTAESSNPYEFSTYPLVEKLREEVVKNYNNPVIFPISLDPDESVFDSANLITPVSPSSQLVPVLMESELGVIGNLEEGQPVDVITSNEVGEWEEGEQNDQVELQLDGVQLSQEDDGSVPSNVIWLLHEHEGQLIAAPTIILHEDPAEESVGEDTGEGTSGELPPEMEANEVLGEGTSGELPEMEANEVLGEGTSGELSEMEANEVLGEGTSGELSEMEANEVLGEGTSGELSEMEANEVLGEGGEVNDEYGELAIVNVNSLMTFHGDDGKDNSSAPDIFKDEDLPMGTSRIQPNLDESEESNKDQRSNFSSSSSSSSFSPIPPPPPVFPPTSTYHGRPRLSKSPIPATHHQCDVCSEQVLKSEIKSHLQSHVGLDFVFHCDSCQVSFLTPFRLDTFHKTLRPKTKKCPTYDPALFKVTYLKCEQCFFQADSIFALKAHLTSHEKGEPGSKKKRKKGDFKCPMCPIRFTIKSSVLIHLQDNHISNKTMRRREVCTECNQTFPVNELESHMEQAHQVNPEFLLRCKLCPSLFSTLEGIVEHQRKAKICRIHPMSCHICNSQFETVVPLRKHYADKHGVRDRFTCRRCHTVFHSLQQVYPTWALSDPDEPARLQKDREVVWKYKCEKCGSTNSV